MPMQHKHKNPGCYQVLRAALAKPAHRWAYGEMALALGIPYATFQKRACREARKLNGFLVYIRSGNRSYLLVSPLWAGRNSSEVLREYRIAKGME